MGLSLERYAVVGAATKAVMDGIRADMQLELQIFAADCYLAAEFRIRMLSG